MTVRNMTRRLVLSLALLKASTTAFAGPGDAWTLDPKEGINRCRDFLQGRRS